MGDLVGIGILGGAARAAGADYRFVVTGAQSADTSIDTEKPMRAGLTTRTTTGNTATIPRTDLIQPTTSPQPQWLIGEVLPGVSGGRHPSGGDGLAAGLGLDGGLGGVVGHVIGMELLGQG